MRNIYRQKYLGEENSDKLIGKTVTIVGLGGIGSVLADILAREEFELRIVDKGRVEERDMNRMSLFVEEDITKFKAKQAKVRMTKINPALKIKSFHEDLDENNVFLVKSDCVVDCSNNKDINELIFKYCQTNKIPLIVASYYGADFRILVANKKLTKKVWGDYLNYDTPEEKGALSAASHIAASGALVELFKNFTTKNPSKQIELDVWDGKLSKKKL